MSEPAWLLGHISDLHLGGRENAGDRAEAVLAHLAALHRPLDALVVTGDVSDAGRLADYQWLSTRLGRFGHVVAVPGNHDDRDGFRRARLGGADGNVVSGPGPVNTVREINGLVVLGCDSSVPGEDSGLLSDETLAWADTVLAEVNPAAPAVLAFHHPPVRLYDQWLDGMRQFGADRLAGLLSRHPRVRALLCGHVHQAVSARFAGVPLIATQSVAPGLRMPGEADLAYVTPPAFAVHALTESGDLTSYLRSLPGPRPGD
ncbi:MAG TPA: metallophosphoesterase [Streptosporangiaceae bacterium]|jgi:3',5'-cyclic AMP phosphodiesterase CpdA|nr:metallophosphoesterase [Streptosporangiaceae bacterium]